MGDGKRVSNASFPCLILCPRDHYLSIGAINRAKLASREACRAGKQRGFPSLPQLRSTIDQSSSYEELQHDSSSNLKRDIINKEFVHPLKGLEAEFATFLQFIEKAIDVEGFYMSGTLRVNPEISKELMALRDSMRSIDEKISNYIQYRLPANLPKGRPGKW